MLQRRVWSESSDRKRWHAHPFTKIEPVLTAKLRLKCEQNADSNELAFRVGVQIERFPLHTESPWHRFASLCYGTYRNHFDEEKSGITSWLRVQIACTEIRNLYQRQSPSWEKQCPLLQISFNLHDAAVAVAFFFSNGKHTSRGRRMESDTCTKVNPQTPITFDQHGLHKLGWSAAI